jgi:hypothetical protein
MIAEMESATMHWFLYEGVLPQTMRDIRYLCLSARCNFSLAQLIQIRASIEEAGLIEPLLAIPAEKDPGQ